MYARGGIQYGETRSSDIGYVNDIFMGGIFYCSILYSGYIILIHRAKKGYSRKTFERSYFSLLALSIILINLKGEYFRSPTLQEFCILLIVVMTNVKNKQTIDNGGEEWME